MNKFVILIWIHSVYGGCGPGLIKTRSGSCIDCPGGYSCGPHTEYPVLCSKGTYAFQGSSQCCNLNMSCPLGFAVNANDGCSCSKIRCPIEFPHMVFDSSSNAIQCTKRNTMCTPCAMSSMVQNKDSCACVQNKFCHDTLKQAWISFSTNTFVCIPKSV